MRVLVSGSSGLIGTAAVSHLRQAGHEVHRLVRRAAGAPDEHGWDPPSGRIDPGALEGVDVVVNLNGSAQQPRRWSGAYKQQLRDSRIVPSEVLANAVADHGVPTLLNISGVNVYGDTGSAAVDESGPDGPGFMADLVRDWEAATVPAEKAGARVVLMRTAPVLAKGSPLLGLLYPLFMIGGGGKIGSGRQYLSWIALIDHARAIVFAAENPALAGPVNVTSPNPVTNAEFTRAMAEVLHRPALFTAPAFALRAVLGEAAEEQALISLRVLPEALVRAGFTFRYPTIHEGLTAALRE
jgi:uncharacterized protein